jgi:signal transduction histidine kinase
MDIIPRLQAVSLQERKILDQLDMEMLVPLKAAIDIAGILVLGPKLSGEDYSRDDQRLLTVVSRQVSVALDNARLYKEMQDALGQLHKTQEHLLRTERLRAVGEVASGVGHDLRNLLTVVVGRAQLALGRMDHSEKVKHDLEIIEGAALDSAEVVNRLQNFARSDNDRGLCLVKLNQVLLEMVEMLEPRLSQLREMDNIAIDVVLDLLDTECVRGRPSELREMLTNILINAVEAMPKGGKLTVTSRQENDTIVMSIEDTGVGITREVRKGIFEPFFTTKGSEGVGLGLSIARGVAKRHGGDITVSSRPGKGSIFVITLPVSKQIRPEKRALGKVRGPAGDLHVLVIDDDKAVAKVLSEILASAGYAVDLASSGKDGLALAQRKDYSLVITDLGMPGMSGPDVAKAINTMKPAIPTFLVTGWDVELQPAELVNLGITGIITKPFTKASILGQIKHAMK